MLQKIIRVLAEAFLSHDRHMLFALEESEPPRMIYTYPVGNLALLGLNLPLTALVGVAGRRRKNLTCTPINKHNKSKA
jgi:hypothetical protein